MPFTYDNRVRDNILHLRLEGDLLGDVDSTPLLHLAEAHISTGTVNALADLGGIRFLNSSGLSPLPQRRRRATARQPLRRTAQAAGHHPPRSHLHARRFYGRGRSPTPLTG
jgi:hypothetical protein